MSRKVLENGVVTGLGVSSKVTLGETPPNLGAGVLNDPASAKLSKGCLI